jgi:uncharacterized OB-fold protein
MRILSTVNLEYVKRRVLCDYLHLHRGNVRTFGSDDGKITVLDCSRCGRYAHPFVHDGLADLDGERENAVE